MANNLTTSESTALLNLMTGRAGYTTPTNLWCALFTAVADQEAGTVTEVSGGSYARVETIAGTTKWGSAPSGTNPVTIANSVDIVFPTATADWGTVTHMGLNTASTAGTWKWIGQLTASKVVNNGDIFKFLVGQAVLALN